MKYNHDDIVNLNKIINSISQGELDTVPEILDGYNKFPFSNKEKDALYRVYENFLIEKNLCETKNNWNPNSVACGFKELQLASEGYAVKSSKISIEDILQKDIEDKEKKKIEFEKLRIDFKNAKRIFKTYWFTFFFAITAFIISLVTFIKMFFKQ